MSNAAVAQERLSQRTYNLTSERRDYLFTHPDAPIGEVALALGVPPYAVQQWLARVDITETKHQQRVERTKAIIAAVHPRSSIVQLTPVATPGPVVETPAPALPAVREVPEYPGVQVAGSEPILTPELRNAIVDKVRALTREAAVAMAQEAVRGLVCEMVQQGFREILSALDRVDGGGSRDE